MTSQPILVTTCSKRKTSTPVAYLKPSEMFKTQQDLGDHWVNLLKNCPQNRRIPAQALYSGRGFRKAFNAIGDASRLWIVSSGLGLVSSEQTVVPYNLTVSIGANEHVKEHLEWGRFDSAQWWLQVNEGQTKLLELIRSNEGLTILAMSRSYLEMLSNELAAATEEDLTKLRIIGNDLEQVSDIKLFPYIMPYDARIDAEASQYAGSKIDFPQRAASHFIQEILSKNPQALTAREHQTLVHESMKSLGTIAESAQRSSVDDNTIRDYVLKEWDNCFGRFTRLLQTIRKQYKVSCSENRLRRIYQEIVQDIAAGVDVFKEHTEVLEEA